MATPMPQFQVRRRSSDGKNWQDYDSFTNAIIANAYLSGAVSVELSIGTLGPYVITFNPMEQFVKNNPKKSRRIRIFNPALASASSSIRTRIRRNNKHPHDSIHVENTPYPTPTMLEEGILYAMVQDPNNKSPTIAMLTRIIQLPISHPKFPGVNVIQYGGQYFLHHNMGPSSGVSITTIEGVPYSTYLQQKESRAALKAQEIASQMSGLQITSTAVPGLISTTIGPQINHSMTSPPRSSFQPPPPTGHQTVVLQPHFNPQPPSIPPMTSQVPPPYTTVGTGAITSLPESSQTKPNVPTSFQSLHSIGGPKAGNPVSNPGYAVGAVPGPASPQMTPTNFHYQGY